MKYYCGKCPEEFATKGELNLHFSNHPDTSPGPFKCPTCQWEFEDSHALATHQAQNGHGLVVHERDENSHTASRGLYDTLLGRHNSTSSNLETTSDSSTMPTHCDRCSKTFDSHQAYVAHRAFPLGECADYKVKTPPKSNAPMHVGIDGNLDVKPPAFAVPRSGISSNTPDDVSVTEHYCHACKTAFSSQAQYNKHVLQCDQQLFCGSCNKFYLSKSSFNSHTLWCSTHNASTESSPIDIRAHTSIAPSVKNHSMSSSTQTEAQFKQITVKNAQPTAEFPFVCNEFRGCAKMFRFSHSLDHHRRSVHGMSHQDQQKAKAPKKKKKKSQELAQQVQQLAQSTPRLNGDHALSPGQAQGDKLQLRNRAVERPSNAPIYPSPRPKPSPRATPMPPVPNRSSRAHPLPPHRHGAPPHAPYPTPMPPNMNTSDGSAEMEQAKKIQSKIMALLIPSDIFITEKGEIKVGGLTWKRIPVYKQLEVIKSFDAMCTLPKALQKEYMPPPAAFKGEHPAPFPMRDFKQSPVKSPAEARFPIVALYCSKVLLDEGCQEAVKVAAIDVLTGRVLMDHLVCTARNNPVKDWRTRSTGLTSWDDMEAARQNGYKILKGWSATRSALWKFIDFDTIVVGHNLRADLDVLRMQHGRAVDIAKYCEKIANSPFSKAQLSLDSMCRDFCGKKLTNDPRYGRDCLTNAFAIRELALWAIKHPDEFKKKNVAKSLDYQKLMPK